MSRPRRSDIRPAPAALAGRDYSRPDVALVVRLLDQIHAARSSKIRAIWKTWARRWTRVRKDPRSVASFTDRFLTGLVMVGTAAAHELYSDAVRDWFDLCADAPPCA